MVEEQLLNIKGIISFTFDMSHRRCTVRGRADLKPQVCVCVDACSLYMCSVMSVWWVGIKVLNDFMHVNYFVPLSQILCCSFTEFV